MLQRKQVNVLIDASMYYSILHFMCQHSLFMKTPNIYSVRPERWISFTFHKPQKLTFQSSL